MAKIKHPYGNVFILGIPLVKRVIEFTDGLRSQNDHQLTPLLEDAPIKVIFGRGGAVRYERDAKLDEDGFVVVKDNGKLPMGFYNVTVLATDSNGDPLRFKDNLVLRIVDSTAEADYSDLAGYDGYFKFPLLAFNSSGGRGSLWDRELTWQRESSWYSRNN
jgi:hypothetical protein